MDLGWVPSGRTRLAVCNDINLYGDDLRTFLPGSWLNDNAITFALEMILNQLDPQRRQKVHVVQPSLVELLKMSDDSQIISACFEDVDLPSKDLILFVINDNEDASRILGGHHWALLIFSRPMCSFIYLDSLTNADSGTLQWSRKVVKMLMEADALNAHNVGFEVGECSKQRNGSDCGMFVLEFARCLLKVFDPFDPYRPPIGLRWMGNVICQMWKGGLRDRNKWHRCGYTHAVTSINPRDIKDERLNWIATMITPVFEIQQDEKSLIFKIRAPYANLRELEVEFTENLFLFSCAPYYLRVHLPKKVREDDMGDNTKYDCDSGVFTIVVPKLNEGEVFEDLDMISELLRPQKPPTAERMVEEIGDEDGSDFEDEMDEEENEEQYYQDQKLQDVAAGIKDEESNLFGYGFGWRRNGVLEQLRGQIGNVVDLLEPEMCPLSERVATCAKFDEQKFDPGRYLVDTLQPEEDLMSLIESSFQANTALTEEDRTKLKDLPNRKLPKLSASDEKATALSLVDLVYAWAYDQRTNGWEGCCETGWTISRLSPTLAFLLRWDNANQALIGAVRRSLCYPIYRNWDLAMKVVEDTVAIFKQGKSALVHILCEIHSAMVHSSEFRYLLNDLLLTDLLLWIQAAPTSLIEEVSESIADVKVSKEDVELDLEELELNGRMQIMTTADSDDEE